MGMTELVVLAVGLAMDAFAVSVCKGLSAGRVTLGHALTAGLWFGGFQALMPFLGWLLGVQFQSFITSIDHWIAFVLLGLIGINMIRGVPQHRGGGDGDLLRGKGPCSPWQWPPALTPSPWASPSRFSASPSAPPSPSSGSSPVCCPPSASRRGGVVGEKGKSWAELAGGIVLILMGSKILLEHLGVLG